jgi:hypothetical protein
MKTVIKLLGVIAFTLGLFLIVVSFAFYYLVRTGEFQRFVLDEMEAKTELKIQLGEANLEVGRILGIGFRDFALSEPNAAQPEITAQRVTARVALRPLFQRKLVLYGVRLYKPTARVVRDKEGRIPLLDKLLSLPFLKQEATQFGVDLQAIGIQDGEVDFEDQQAKGGHRTLRYRNIDLDLERIRGHKLTDFIRELIKLKQPQPKGMALDFDLRSVVGTGNETTTARAKGRMVFPQETLELRNAWWNVQLQFDNLSPGLVQQYAGGPWPVKSVTGIFAPRFHLEGSLVNQIRLRGVLSFKQFGIDAPDLFAAPLSPGDGQAEFDVDWKPQRLAISRFDFRSKELRFTMQGETGLSAGADSRLQLNLTAPWLPLVMLRKYLPVKTLGSPPLERFAADLKAGELQLKRVGISGTLGEMRNAAVSAAKGLFWFEGELRGVRAEFDANGYPPLDGVQGLVRLDKGVFTFQDLKGRYGQSRFANVEGSYALVPAAPGTLDIRGTGDLDLAELGEQMKTGLFPAQVAKLSSSLSELGGRAQIRLSLQRSGETTPRFEGKVTLDKARLRFEDIALTEMTGDLSLSPVEIRTEKLRALLSNSPVEIQLALINYASDDSNFDLRVDSTGVKAGIVAHLLLGTGSPEDPGTVRGSVRYQGSFGNKGTRKFTGNLDLVDVKLDHKPLLQPLRELSGRVNIDETGIDFQGLKGLLVGSRFEFDGRWRYKQNPQLLFSFAAPTLDVAYLISQIDPESTEWYATLTAQGKVGLIKGRLKGFEFTGLKTDLTLDHRVWQLKDVTMDSAGGVVEGTATVADNPDIVSFSLTPKIQSVPLQGVLNWFEAGQAEMTGKVNITGKLESKGNDSAERKQNLNGAFSLRIEDGTIHRLRVLVQILNLLDLSRWFTLRIPDLGKNGIRFRTISGDFHVNQGVFSTENLIVDSDDLRMTGGGKIDLANDQIDFVLAVRPFAGIDTVINYIPLIGRGIAAIKNSFLVASFNIKGPVDEPTITPAPLSTLSEWFLGVLGIPKNAIGWGGGDEKKDEPINGRPKESTKEPAPPETK